MRLSQRHVGAVDVAVAGGESEISVHDEAVDLDVERDSAAVRQGGIGIPGSHHPQFLDVLHRSHATVEYQVRAGKAMGLRNLPSKAWTVKRGWILTANIAADLAAWTRLPGLYDQPDLTHAEPDTLRYRLPTPTRELATHARRRTLSIPNTWPWATAFLLCWQCLNLLPQPI